MPKNGDMNTQLALYRSLCCDQELVIREDEAFPDCPRHKNLSTVWKLIQAEHVPMGAVKKLGPPAA